MKEISAFIRGLVEAASARPSKKEKLETRCRNLIEAPTFTSQNWSDFCSAMSRLLGARKKDELEIATLIDSSAGFVIAIFQPSTIVVEPFAGQQVINSLFKEAGLPISHISLSAAAQAYDESITWGAKEPLSRKFIRSGYAAVNGLKEVKSYVTGEIFDFEKYSKYGSVREAPLSAEQAQQFCQKLFSVYKSRV